MGRHTRPRVGDPVTVGLRVPVGGIGLYPCPDETPEQAAEWLDRSWSMWRMVSMDDRLFARMPYDCEIGSEPAIDPRTGRRRGRSRRV